MAATLSRSTPTRICNIRMNTGVRDKNTGVNPLGQGPPCVQICPRHFANRIVFEQPLDVIMFYFGFYGTDAFRFRQVNVLSISDKSRSDIDAGRYALLQVFLRHSFNCEEAHPLFKVHEGVRAIRQIRRVFLGRSYYFCRLWTRTTHPIIDIHTNTHPTLSRSSRRLCSRPRWLLIDAYLNAAMHVGGRQRWSSALGVDQIV